MESHERLQLVANNSRWDVFVVDCGSAVQTSTPTMLPDIRACHRPLSSGQRICDRLPRNLRKSLFVRDWIARLPANASPRSLWLAGRRVNDRPLYVVRYEPPEQTESPVTLVRVVITV